MISKNLRVLRKKLGLTQSELAEKLGARQQSWAHYENDRRKPTLDLLLRLQEKYAINLHWLITGNGNMFVDEGPADSVADQRQSYHTTAELNCLGKAIKALQHELNAASDKPAPDKISRRLAELASQNQELVETIRLYQQLVRDFNKSG